MTSPKIVSLFSGAGGLDLGFYQAGFPLVFAVDSSPAAVRTHKRNFPRTTSIAADLVELGPSGVLTSVKDLLEPGEEIGVIGGPPCQGFSRANSNSKAGDPRNALPLLYLDVVRSLQQVYNVRFVLFENVLGIRDSKHATAFESIMMRFKKINLQAGFEVYSALDFGVAQSRQRVIISGFRSPVAAAAFAPNKVPKSNLTVRSAIGGLPPPAYYARGLTPDQIPYHPNHWTMRPISSRFSDPERMQTTGRSFRVLDWEKPSPTVAYGHREIHVHPSGKRRLSIYEAMLLQGFPTEFVIEGTLSAQVEQVSNAVPPPLAKALADATREALVADRFDSTGSAVVSG